MIKIEIDGVKIECETVDEAKEMIAEFLQEDDGDPLGDAIKELERQADRLRPVQPWSPQIGGPSWQWEPWDWHKTWEPGRLRYYC